MGTRAPVTVPPCQAACPHEQDDHDYCACAHLAADVPSRELAAQVQAAVLPLLSADVQAAEISVAVVPARDDTGEPEVILDGCYVAPDGKTVDLSLGARARELARLFAKYPSRLLAAGYGPSNLYIISLKRNEEPRFRYYHDAASAGGMSVHDICADMELLLRKTAPEHWEELGLQLFYDPENEEMADFHAFSVTDREETDHTEELAADGERMEALLHELRAAVETADWDMAEFILRSDGKGELGLYQTEEESEDDGPDDGAADGDDCDA